MEQLLASRSAEGPGPPAALDCGQTTWYDRIIEPTMASGIRRVVSPSPSNAQTAAQCSDTVLRIGQQRICNLWIVTTTTPTIKESKHKRPRRPFRSRQIRISDSSLSNHDEAKEALVEPRIPAWISIAGYSTPPGSNIKRPPLDYRIESLDDRIR